MAQRLPNCDLASAGRPAKYPWREWADGSVWHVVRGVDYDVATRSMRATLFAYAAREDLAVRTRRVTVDARRGWSSALTSALARRLEQDAGRRAARRRRGRRTRRSGFRRGGAPAPRPFAGPALLADAHRRGGRQAARRRRTQDDPSV